MSYKCTYILFLLKCTSRIVYTVALRLTIEIVSNEIDVQTEAINEIHNRRNNQIYIKYSLQ